jgi:hypothetical protein
MIEKVIYISNPLIIFTVLEKIKVTISIAIVTKEQWQVT